MRFFTDGTEGHRAGGEALTISLAGLDFFKRAGLSLFFSFISPRNVHKLLLRLSISSVYSGRSENFVAARLAAAC